MPLSKRALEMLAGLFSEQSNMALPAGLAAEALEVRAWVQAQLQQR